mmetsp:Transcript_22858/g.65989  ORF Transcript_22858/g.65989 Transcript_22858/m.65989 type:complete len:327 (+) Transcript_22858:100-1080(+)
MSRHSKHSNDRSFYTHKERKEAGFAGTRKDVLGTDCFLPFGHCALSLKAPKEPVCTPEGWIYDREFILENLLRQKLEKQADAKKYEAQEQRKARAQQAELQEADQREIDEFRRAEQSLLSEDARHKRALDRSSPAGSMSSTAGGSDRPEKKLRQGELLVVDKAKFREKSFWAPQCTQSAAPAELKKVDTTTRCPMSGKKLRVKDLIPVKFEVYDQKMLQEGGGRGVFCCAVSKHPITHQQAVLIKPSGVVVLESVLEDCVYKDMVCPVTGAKLKGKDDILKLQQGGTGFASHNEVEAKSFSMIRSFAGDARTQQGHLPRAGFVGLH